MPKLAQAVAELVASLANALSDHGNDLRQDGDVGRSSMITDYRAIWFTCQVIT